MWFIDDDWEQGLKVSVNVSERHCAFWHCIHRASYCNVYINQRDAEIHVNSLYFFVKWLYMFRTVISPSSGATFNKLYSAIGTCQYVWLLCYHSHTAVFRNMHILLSAEVCFEVATKYRCLSLSSIPFPDYYSCLCLAQTHEVSNFLYLHVCFVTSSSCPSASLVNVQFCV